MIDIVELKGCELRDLLDLIDQNKDDSFEIYVPKQTEMYFNERSDIAYDYIRAALAGQILSDISTKFSYKKVLPEHWESILFEVSIIDKEKLAEALLQITYVYEFNEDPNADEFEPHETIENFIGNVESGAIKSTCQYFIDVWRKFASVEDE